MIRSRSQFLALFARRGRVRVDQNDQASRVRLDGERLLAALVC
jgi:hypothetical protein